MLSQHPAPSPFPLPLVLLLLPWLLPWFHVEAGCTDSTGTPETCHAQWRMPQPRGRCKKAGHRYHKLHDRERAWALYANCLHIPAQPAPTGTQSLGREPAILLWCHKDIGLMEKGGMGIDRVSSSTDSDFGRPLPLPTRIPRRIEHTACRARPNMQYWQRLPHQKGTACSVGNATDTDTVRDESLTPIARPAEEVLGWPLAFGLIPQLQGQNGERAARQLAGVTRPTPR